MDQKSVIEQDEKSGNKSRFFGFDEQPGEPRKNKNKKRAEKRRQESKSEEKIIRSFFADMFKIKDGIESVEFGESRDQKFAQRRVNVKIIFAGEIGRYEFAKMHLVKNNLAWMAQAGEMDRERQNREQ